MSKYIEYVSDYLLDLIDETPIYKTENPFSFMQLISLEANENMFEIKGHNYSNGVSNQKALENEDDW